MSRGVAAISEDRIARMRCPVCRQHSMKRVEREFAFEVAYDGRGPYTIRIPDLAVIACTNPACRPENPGDQVLHDDATTWRITIETYRQLGLLTPEEIREQREKLGLTQQQLGELLGLGGNSLSRWENGRVYQSRSIDTLLRIVFEVPEALAFVRRRRGVSGADEADFARRFRYLAPTDMEAMRKHGRRTFTTPREFLAQPDEEPSERVLAQ